MILDAILGWFSSDLAIDLGTANTVVLAKGMRGHGLALLDDCAIIRPARARPAA